MQTARGASLKPSETGRSTSRRVTLFVLVAVLALVADQVSKQLAVTRLAGRDDVRLVGDLLQLTLVRNPGAAFSTGTGVTPLFTALSAVATVVVAWFGLRARTPLWAAGLGLLLAGVFGNLLDRLFRTPGVFRGHVVDFLMLPHWPVFNLADMFIDIGAAVIVIQAVRGIRLDGGRSSDDVAG